MTMVLRFRPQTSDVSTDAFESESEVRSYCRRIDATFVSASGSFMIDTQGRRYIDFLAGASTLNYGHNDPDLAEALVRYITTGGVAHGLDLHTAAKSRFIDTFNRYILRPRGMNYKLQFPGPTGTNAVEAAMKLARKVTGRTDIIAFTNAFHGMTLGSLAATGSDYYRSEIPMPLSGVTRAFYDGYFGPGIDTAAMLEKLLDDPSSGYGKPAAIILETIQGEGGLNVARPEWIQRIAAIAKRHGALLIIDDIQAGCGRSGTFFSFEMLDISPDIVVLSKSLSGYGLPMALVLIAPEHDKWKPGEHNGTFRGNNLAFVTAAAAIEKYWSDTALPEDILRRSHKIRVALERMSGFIPGSAVKGRGMMLGLDTRDGSLAEAICRRCYANGLIIETSGPNDEVVKILAPLTTSDEVLSEGLGILEAAVLAESNHLEATA